MHLTGGAAIFGLFIVIYFAAVALSMYTRRGSAINQHPYRNPEGAAPGASRRGTLSHDDREPLYLVRRGTR